MHQDEFHHFIRTNSAALQRAAYLLTGDVQLAEDLAQVALTKTGLAWNRLREQGNALAYARRVVYTEHVTWWRRRRVVEQLGQQLTEPPPVGDPYAEVDLRLLVRAALLHLPARQRAVVVCRYFDDLTEVETAHVLGIAVGTVKSQTHRGLASLRAALPTLELIDSTEGQL